MTNEVEKQRFRNEIQGLRASASLLIAVYHIWFNRVSGGVDVFFVVSGFLIIGSLTREATSNGAVELGAYFTRMARRIVPLAYVIIALTVVGVWIFVSRIYWEDMFRGIRAAVGYFAKYIQTFDIMADTDGNGYLFVDQKTSDVSYHEKPGISCFASIRLKNKYILLQ